MLPYYILFGVPALYGLFCSAYGRKQTLRQKRKEISLFFLWLLIMLMLRDTECGIDLKNYELFFKDAIRHPFENRYDHEWGYHVLESVIGLFTDNFQVFLTIDAILCICPLLWMYKKEVEIPYLSIILFAVIAPFSMYFSGLRQATAMAFAVPAYYYTKEKRIWRFVLTVFAACLFHKSALILVAMYPAYHIKLTKKSLSWIVPLFLVVLVFNQQIFSVLMRFLGEKYNERYSATGSTGAYAILILLVILGVYAFALTKETDLEKDVMGLRNILLLAVFLQSFALIHSIAMRMNYYFLPFVPLLIPKIANRSTTKNRKIAKLSVMVMCVGLTVLYFYKAYTDADILNIYPYIPFWEK